MASRALPIARRHLRSVDSTNSYAKACVGELSPAHLTVVTADEQTAGRGRAGRVWKSGAPGSDIMASFVCQLPSACLRHAYLLSPFMSLMAVRWMKAATSLAVGIKWPNDIIVQDSMKVGGILCELQPHGAEMWA
ncbi:MAG: biotin--[acetyl-CoA-carboxylase] ligase, partial [Methanosarcinales archaeon]